ncbi:hypothetical protein EDC02_5930 [Micromonospora sp. Llam0]|uniref:phage capsid protein n=1 Tax=Micromonospora sp. Llam0 TaxID=2485143 RepID=UPI000F473D79|nr:phage capsid protein [Micromonospora sp. Llam0]ROO51066.1 hypothetical protein EDC02_5930 [Micromonospora sp. Llam0]
MPMPTNGSEWPPAAHAPAYQAYTDWDAWFVGDPAELADVYQRRGVTTHRIRPSQMAGGLVGLLSRWMWGQPVRSDQRDTRLHVPVPADLAATSAGMLFSEAPTLTCKSTAAQDAVDQLAATGLTVMLRHAAELGSVLGDVYLRPVVDPEISPTTAIPTAVPADAVIPTIRWGKLVEATLWSTLTDSGGTVVRLLEHHDVVSGVGRIEYRLFEGTPENLGRPIPLTEHPDAEWAAALVDADGYQSTGLDRLDIVRVANAGPQRRWRKLGPLKYHGRSDFDGNEPLFDRIDEVWTSWMQDIRNGRGRITVPDYMLQSNGRGAGATWDADREVYSAVNALPDQNVGLTVTQFAIRHVEHKATIDELMQTAMRHAGLSAQTLGEEGDVAMTATEAHARERQSFVTQGDRQNSFEPGIADYTELHLMLDAIHFGGTTPERPSVAWPDGVAESPETIARTLQLVAAAEAASTRTKVMMLHPDWTPEQVAEEVAEIKGDQPAPVEVGPALGALAGNGPPADEGQGDEQEEQPEE